MRIINLPDGWALSTLPESIAIDGLISDGDWVESKDQDPNGSIRLIQLADIGDGKFKNKSERFMSRDRADVLNCTYLQSGDVLIARMPDPLGRACLFPDIGQDAVTVVDICLIRTGANTAISNKLLIHWINSPSTRDLIYANASGATRTRITRKKLELFEFPIPPLAEQKVIAEKLDNLLTQVEITKAHLERIPSILKIFRQAVLSAAVSGKLTEEWRNKNHFLPSNPNKGKERFKKDLFNSATESLPELPNEWIVVPAASVLEYVTSGSRGWANYYADEGALFLRMSNVRFDTTKLDLNDLQYVNLPESVEGKRSLVKKNDLVISITADIGRVAVIDIELEEAYVNQHLALLRPTKDINSEYLATCIAAVNIGVKQVQALKRGATKSGLGLDDIRSLAIPFPAIEEQAEIVLRVEDLFAFADSIEQKADAALARVSNLTQSVLVKAFTGELTADWRAANPELISGDNSAEALLKKIKTDREAIERQPKPKRSTIKEKTDNRMSKQIIKVAEALKKTGKPLSGQQLLAAAGYPSDSNTEQLEQFFLDIRNALAIEQSIVKLERDNDSQDWFALAKDSQ